MSPITPKRQQLMDKIVKLLALAESSTFTEEAASARQFAAKLMAEHNISMCEATVEQAPFEVVVEETGRASMACKHDDVLNNTLARLSGVYMVRYEGRYKFAGRTGDIEAFQYVRDIVLQQREAAWKQYYPTKPKAVYSKASHRAEWKLGFAYGVAKRVRELMEMCDSHQTERGLVPVSPLKQAEDWFKADNAVRDSKGRASQYNRAGFEAGRNVSLNKAVTTQSTTARIAG